MSNNKEKKKLEKRDVLIVAAIIILGLALVFNVNIDDLDDFLSHVEEEDANVELYQFTELKGNNSLTTELWLLNTGEKTAKNITVYVRLIDQDGDVRLSMNISTTTVLLRENETCSGVYTIDIEPEDTQIKHTIEITWNNGRKAYSRTTSF